MPGEIEFIITRDHLGSAAPEFGIAAGDLKLIDEGCSIVKVLVDGKLAEQRIGEEETIIVEASPRADGSMLTVVVTTEDDRIINILKYDPIRKTLTIVEPVVVVGQARLEETILTTVIDTAADRIIAAIEKQKSRRTTGSDTR